MSCQMQRAGCDCEYGKCFPLRKQSRLLVNSEAHTEIKSVGSESGGSVAASNLPVGPGRGNK